MSQGGSRRLCSEAEWTCRAGGGTGHLVRADEGSHWCFDLRGRLLMGRLGPAQLQLGLSGDGLLRIGDRSTGYGAPARMRPDRVATWLADARRAASRALSILPPSSLEPHAAATLQAASQWGCDDEASHQERYRRAYRPVRMLPPDAYRALLVQASEGCAWGRCTFCTLYGGETFRAKDSAALDGHLDAVAELLGPNVQSRRGVFLGDANACVLSQARLLEVLRLVRARFPGPAAKGVQAFADPCTGPPRSPSELEALREAGLTRLTIGLESGHDGLVRSLNKPATPAAVGAFVRRLKQAGLLVSLTVLLGAERLVEDDPARATELGRAHVRETVRLIRGLPLEREDRIYLSPLEPGSVASDAAAQVQERALRAQLQGAACQVALYRLSHWLH